MKSVFLLQLLVPLSLLAQPFEPQSGPLSAVNQVFHDSYNGWVNKVVKSFGQPGHPVMVLTGDSLLFLHNEQRQSFRIIPPLYHKLKSIDHLSLGLFSLLSSFPEGGLNNDQLSKIKNYEQLVNQITAALAQEIPQEQLQNQQNILTETRQYIHLLLTKKQNLIRQRDAYARHISALLLENASESAKLQIQLLHETVSNWKKLMDTASFHALYVVIGSSHQARYRQLSIQYFDKLLHQRTGATALTEDRVVAAEGISDEKQCLSLLARHLIDQQIGLSYFGDKFRMQRDLLSDGATRYLETIFPPAHKKK